MDQYENLIQRKLPYTKVDAQEEIITSSDDDNSKQEMLQDSRSDLDVQDDENLSGGNTVYDVENSSGDIIMHDVENPSGDNTVYYVENSSEKIIMHEVKIATEDNTVQGVENRSGDNTVQDLESPNGDNTIYYAENPSGDIIMHEVKIVTEDNTVQGVENPSGDNTVQDVEYPNRGKNMEGVTDNPCGHTSCQKSFRNNNFGGETSHLIPYNQMKSQLEIATGGIAQNHLRNTNEKVETEPSNRGVSRQRVTPSSYSNEEPQVRQNTFWETIGSLNTMVNEVANLRAKIEWQRSFQRNITSPVYQVFNGIRLIREILLDELISEHQHFRRLLARDRPFLEYMLINLSRKAERLERVQYYSNRARHLFLISRHCGRVYTVLNNMMKKYSDETRRIPFPVIGILRGLRNALTYISRWYRRNELPALDYSSAENARQIQLNNRSSAQIIFDDLHRHRMMVGEEIMREHLHFLQLLLRDRPFLHYRQINSSREAERQRRLRYYLNQAMIFNNMVTWWSSINRNLNMIMKIYYDTSRRITLDILRRLQMLRIGLSRLSAKNVRHVGELPTLDYPD